MVAPNAAPEASRRKPAKQGDLDSLCGLYALINALEQVTVKPPGPALQMRLFASLTEAIPASRLQKALIEGLNGKELLKAARLALHKHKKALKGRIEISRPLRRQSFRSNADFVVALTQLMETGGTAVIVHFATPKYGHWTVVRELRTDALVLKDSYSTRSLSLERYTVKRGPYRLLARETLVLRLRPLKRLSLPPGDP